MNEKNKQFDYYENDIEEIVIKDETNENLIKLTKGLKKLDIKEPPYFKINFKN